MTDAEVSIVTREIIVGQPNILLGADDGAIVMGEDRVEIFMPEHEGDEDAPAHLLVLSAIAVLLSSEGFLANLLSLLEKVGADDGEAGTG